MGTRTNCSLGNKFMPLVGAFWVLTAAGAMAAQLERQPEPGLAEIRALLAKATQLALANRGAQLIEEYALAQTRASDSSAALQTAEAVPDVFSRAVCLAEIGAELARQGKANEALQVTARIEALKQQVTMGKLKQDGFTKEELVAALDHEALKSRTAALLRQALSGDTEGLQSNLGRLTTPYQRNCGALTLALARILANDLAGARSVLEGSKDFLNREGGSFRRLIDVSTALALIQDWSAREWDGNYSNMSRMAYLVSGSADDSYEWRQGHLFAMMVRAGKQQQIDQYLALNQKNNPSGEGIPGVVAGFLVTDDLKNAEKWLSVIREDGDLKSKAQVLIAVARARSGDTAGALDLAGGIKTRPLQAEALAHVALLQAEKGDREGASQTARRALGQGGLVKDPGSSIRTWCVIAQVQALTGEEAAAMRTIVLAEALAEKSKAPQQFNESAWYEWIATAYARIGASADALRVALKEERTGLEKYQQSSRRLCQIAISFANTGKNEDATRAFREALAVHKRLDTGPRETMREWARTLGGGEAVPAAESVAAPQHRAEALLGVAEGLLARMHPKLYPLESRTWPLDLYFQLPHSG